MSVFTEWVLRKISREPELGDYYDNVPGNEVSGSELSLLRREYPNFSALVNGKRIIDFGCGEGFQSIALVKEEHCQVLGLEANPTILERAKATTSKLGAKASEITFLERPTKEMHQLFDVIISQNAMEHYPEPEFVIHEMKSLIHQDGKILITFGPPWFAPYGSHMHFFCKIPWLNIIFSERTVMNVRAQYRNDGAKHYEEVESGLNKMTVRRFEEIISIAGLVIRYKKYSCIKGQDWLAKLPIIRELFINRISVILEFNIEL